MPTYLIECPEELVFSPQIDFDRFPLSHFEMGFLLRRRHDRPVDMRRIVINTAHAVDVLNTWQLIDPSIGEEGRYLSETGRQTRFDVHTSESIARLIPQRCQEAEELID